MRYELQDKVEQVLHPLQLQPCRLAPREEDQIPGLFQVVRREVDPARQEEEQRVFRVELRTVPLLRARELISEFLEGRAVVLEYCCYGRYLYGCVRI